MSATTLMIALLKQGTSITSRTGNRIYPGAPPQDAGDGQIIVKLIHQEEERLLPGATQWPVARISLICRAITYALADRIAEAAIDWLRDKTRVTVAGFEVDVWKEGTDITDHSSQSENGDPYVHQRTVDFYCRYRSVS